MYSKWCAGYRKAYVTDPNGLRKIPLNNLDIVQRLNLHHPNKIDLSLGRIERILRRLGSPEKRLPPVIHVAGTNGKGSLIAFMRAISEAAGLRTHVYTSPHLIRFNERIRLAGEVVRDDMLSSALDECEAANTNRPITFFEITTAIAFLLFSRIPADLTLLETGLGGRLDATNVLTKPVLTALTPISIDHVGFLGAKIAKIAAEKAAIMKDGVESVVAAQEPSVQSVISRLATDRNIVCHYQGPDWRFEDRKGLFFVQSRFRDAVFSMPRLSGVHQLQNAAQAITCLDASGVHTFLDKDIEEGLQTVNWRGRLQRLFFGPLMQKLPRGWEIWVDGGHNAGAGKILAEQARTWSDKPLFAVIGMMKTKDPDTFIAPFASHLKDIIAVGIESKNDNAIRPFELAKLLKRKGYPVKSCPNVETAVYNLTSLYKVPGRILVCGSLYLVGAILQRHR